jgi:hypothetical protein
MSGIGRAPRVAHFALYTNPHIRMCSVITAAVGRWNAEGEELLRRTYRRLGRKTGRYMLAVGVVERGASVEQWGQVSDQILEINGLGGYTEIDGGPDVHAVEVPACARYTEAYRFLHAPRHLCAIPFEWDNGCLDSVSPDVQVWPGPCVYRGDDRCIYAVSRRDAADADTARREVAADPDLADGAESGGASTAVVDAPDWTNPQVGLFALISALINRYGDEATATIRRALFELGVRAGEYLIENGAVERDCTPREWSGIAHELLDVTGFYRHEDVTSTELVHEIRVPDYPYLEPFRYFESPLNILDIAAEWDRGCLRAVNPAIELTQVRCIWRGDADGLWRYALGG